jgi:hypothetical protein
MLAMDAIRNARLTRLLEDAEHSIAAHWERCRDSGLPGATKDATDLIDSRISKYFDELKGLPPAAPESGIIAALSSLYDDLMRLDHETGGGLLEEAERDLLLPLILNAAEAAGLDPHKFPSREPTGRPLDFSAAQAR